MSQRSPHRCTIPDARPDTGLVWECPRCFTRWLWSTHAHSTGYVRMFETHEVRMRRGEAEYRRGERRAMLTALIATVVLAMIVVAVILSFA
jgi:hypothetical protein